MYSGRGFDTGCPIVLTASVSPVTAAFIEAFVDTCLTTTNCALFVSRVVGMSTEMCQSVHCIG